MSHRKSSTLIVLAGMLVSALPSSAYRLWQYSGTGRTTFATALVSCNDPGGFTHWNTANTLWYLNPALQGAGKDAAIYNGMNVWNFVSGASHTLTYKGRTSAGFIQDGINSVSWGSNSGCGSGCLALTAIQLNSGQVIQESDVIFNNSFSWTTNGQDYDTFAVAAHEFGHTVGIHHSDVSDATMSQVYLPFAEWRTLTSDDRAAIQCVQSRYPPSTGCIPDGGVTDGSVACCSGITFGSYTNSDGTFSICASVPPGGCATAGAVDDTNSSTSCCSGAAVSGSTRCLNPADYNNGWATCIHTCQ